MVDIAVLQSGQRTIAEGAYQLGPYGRPLLLAAAALGGAIAVVELDEEYGISAGIYDCVRMAVQGARQGMQETLSPLEANALRFAPLSPVRLADRPALSEAGAGRVDVVDARAEAEAEHITLVQEASRQLSEMVRRDCLSTVTSQSDIPPPEVTGLLFYLERNPIPCLEFRDDRCLNEDLCRKFRELGNPGTASIRDFFHEATIHQATVHTIQSPRFIFKLVAYIQAASSDESTIMKLITQYMTVLRASHAITNGLGYLCVD